MTQPYKQDLSVPEFNPDYYRPDSGGFISEATGARLMQNNDLYRKVKSGDWKMNLTSGNKNLSWRMGREDGKLFVQRRQNNTNAVAEWCANYRKAAEEGFHDKLAPLGPDGKLQFMWVNLPVVIKQRIQDDYFGGMDWEVIKRDQTTKSQWYQVIQQEYPAFICYPGGVLPIPVKAPYPSKKDQKNLFTGR